MRKIYTRLNNVWEMTGYACPHCTKTFKGIQFIERHVDLCKAINTLKKLREDLHFMPVQRVMQDGKTYYRWGSEGKLYSNIKDAEAQGRAIYAAGYQEVKDQKAKK